MMFPEVLEQLTVAYNLGFQKAEKDDVEKFKEDLVNTLNSTYRLFFVRSEHYFAS